MDTAITNTIGVSPTRHTVAVLIRRLVSVVVGVRYAISMSCRPVCAIHVGTGRAVVRGRCSSVAIRLLVPDDLCLALLGVVMLLVAITDLVEHCCDGVQDTASPVSI